MELLIQAKYQGIWVLLEVLHRRVVVVMAAVVVVAITMIRSYIIIANNKTILCSYITS